MPLVPLQFRPGINRESTDYSNKGGWFDCNLVRFRAGFPETIGGWTRYTLGPMLGACRALFSWTALDGTLYLAAGTHKKLYTVFGSQPYDITPLRATTAPGGATFAATSGSSLVTVTDTLHGAGVGDFVTFSGAAGLGGAVTAGVLNAEHEVVSVADANTYQIDVGVSATAGDTGNGGASVVAAYQINIGLNTVIFGDGWGAGGWGEGPWGGPAAVSVAGAQLRLWSLAAFGEDLLACVRDDGIYYWDKSTGVTARAVTLSSLPGAQAVPQIAKQVMVSERDRHVLAFGCDGEFTPGVQDPMLIRFSSQEDPVEWRARPETTAGDLRLRTGTEIICAVQTKQQTLVLTDAAAYTLQYVGAPFTFGVTEVASSTTVISPNAAIAVGESVYWMGYGEFYIFDGSVRQIPCSVREFVFSNFNYDQRFMVCAGSNAEFGEIWWFYPAVGCDCNTRYVVFNYLQNVWYYGELGRTAWVDRSTFPHPLAAATDGYIYAHEEGLDDGEQNPPGPLNAYIESSPLELDNGDRFAFAKAILPDITFRSSTAMAPHAVLTLKARRYPGSDFLDDTSKNVIKTAVLPVEQFTPRLDIRLRGRALSVRLESNDAGVAWRMGTPRVDVRSDGAK